MKLFAVVLASFLVFSCNNNSDKVDPVAFDNYVSPCDYKIPWKNVYIIRVSLEKYVVKLIYHDVLDTYLIKGPAGNGFMQLPEKPGDYICEPIYFPDQCSAAMAIRDYIEARQPTKK